MSRPFKYEFFDCLQDKKTFQLACLCPCILYGKNKQILYKQPDSLTDSIIYGLVMIPCFGACLACEQRGEIRKRLGIEGTPAEDFCRHLCCGACAVTQETRELHDTIASIAPQPQMNVQDTRFHFKSDQRLGFCLVSNDFKLFYFQ